MERLGRIIVTQDFEEALREVQEECRERGVTLIPIVKEGNFLVEDAELAIEKAYLASEEPQLILLAGERFSEVVQNKLLKLLEEPPPKKEFVLLFRGKSEILPTIRSRMPVKVHRRQVSRGFDELDLKSLDIEGVYEFVQSKGRLGAEEAKDLLQRLLPAVLESGEYELDEKSLELFRDGLQALDLGSPPAFVMTGILLKLLARKRRRMR
ncbi:DNA polymerase III subunit delta' [Nitratifractor sp.]